jgi:hypothetical protein
MGGMDMMAARVGKILFLLVVLFVFVLCFNLLQLNIAANQTLLSDEYFERTFDEHDVAGNITRLMEASMARSTTAMMQTGDATMSGFETADDFSNTSKDDTDSQDTTAQTDAYQVLLEENIDMAWVDEEISNTVKGVFSYFIGDAKKLPEINIQPLKEAYFQVLVDQIIANSDETSIEQTEFLIYAVQQGMLVYSPDGTVNDQVVDGAMTLALVRDAQMSRESVRKIAEKIAVMNQDHLTSVDIRDYIISEMVRDKMNIQEMQDKLDLSLFFETVYGDEENPVSETASLMDTLKNGTTSIIIMAVVLLVLIISLTAFYPQTAFRWIGAGIVTSSVIVLLTGFLTWMVSRNAFSSSSDLMSFGLDSDGAFFRDWIAAYSEGFYAWLMIQAGILLLLGVLLIIVSAFLPDKFKLQKKWNGTKAGRILLERKGRNTLVLIRVILVILLSVGLLICVQLYIAKIKESLRNLERASFVTSDQTMEPAEALGIVLDAEDLFASMRDENQNATNDQG